MQLVYIAEAHASDQWPINSSRCAGPGNSVTAPTSLDERRRVAARMLDALPCLAPLPLLVDDVDDALLRTLAAWPVRLFGVHRGVLEFIGEPSQAAIVLLR